MNIADWKSLPPEIIKVLRKYRIISVQDIDGRTVEGYTTANLRKARDAEGKVLGDGPLVAQDVIARFLDAVKEHPTPEVWLDWILFQSGGGQEAQRRANQAMEQVKERFLDERQRGYRDMRGKYHPPISRQEGEAMWDSTDARFKEVIQVGDQDMAEKLQVFGFHRNWPGPNKIYARAASTVKTWIGMKDRVDEMNDFMFRSEMKGKTVPTDLSEFTTVDSLDQAVKKVERFFDSREARQDIRIETIFENDIVQVLCPLTYSAAVRYGWDTWPFSNRSMFEQCLEGTSTWNDPWRKLSTDAKTVVYFNFKVPMPSWVSYAENQFKRFTLHNLCCFIPNSHMRRIVPASAEFVDEESRKSNIDVICATIREEATREVDPEKEEYPVQRGPRVYETEEEAEAVVDAFEQAWDALVLWGSQFDHKKVVVDYLPKQ